ncbi:MAG: HupE/UreJ family protein [Bacteroidota bacterium]|nr:HupE/UreJ family protein [Bacteroidota bacterium]
MSIFRMYLELGLNHITDIKGYDHILFIICLCAIYYFRHWKKVLILVTAFTLGHSLTLALATLGLISIRGDIVEFVIPLTIFITATGNFFQRNGAFSNTHHRFKYLAAMVFGLVHGLGFSNYLRGLLGGEENIIAPLLAFNIGVELGQIIIVIILLTLAFLFDRLFRVKNREWNLVLSGAGMGVSLVLMLERWPF